MKGKLFKYDPNTGKMVEITTADITLSGGPEEKTEPCPNCGKETVLLPIPIPVEVVHEPAPNFTPDQKKNLRNIFRKADEHAEAMDRRDCVRVQERIARLREHYGIDE